MTTGGQKLVTAHEGVGATICPFPKSSSNPAPNPIGHEDAALEQAGELAAHAMTALLRLASARPVPPLAKAFASGTELSQLIDTFLKIRDPDQRRYCLAVVRSCAIQDETRR